MPIVGFNLSKVYAEKKISKVEEKIKIQIRNDVLITNLEEEKLPTGKSKADGLRFDFKYSLKYEPSVGEIELIGFVYYLDDLAEIKTILKNWKKDKKLPPELTTNIVNTILFKGNIKALSLSQEINLPPHLAMPTVNPKADSESYIG